MASALLTSPHLADLIMIFTVLEGVAVARWRGIPPRVMASMLLPGIFLLLALRVALAGAAWPWVPVALTGALFAHVFDLWTRFKS